jgi:hypothetical protein
MAGLGGNGRIPGLSTEDIEVTEDDTEDIFNNGCLKPYIKNHCL